MIKKNGCRKKQPFLYGLIHLNVVYYKKKKIRGEPEWIFEHL